MDHFRETELLILASSWANFGALAKMLLTKIQTVSCFRTRTINENKTGKLSIFLFYMDNDLRSVSEKILRKKINLIKKINFRV